MDEVSQIREKIDIVSLISEYIPLQKAGRNFKALCPFHTEKSPSFVVSPERQIWHCFGGCGKGGDCFTFLMEYENLEFVEALRILSKRTGIELRSSGFSSGLSSKKEKIYTLNRLALAFYQYVLLKHSVGKSALTYLKEKRKISEALIKTFMLGFSPGAGTGLVQYLTRKKGYKDVDLLEAGLAFQNRGQLFDFFRNRIMFPLFDHRSNCVGFSGRAIDESSYGGKYVNTKETLAYHKGDMFFGLNNAKEEIKKLNQAIVVEGEFDVISSYGEGVKNVVAVKGTALTEHQAMLLSRFTNVVCLCFDQDAAGLEATKRSLFVLEQQGFNIHVIQFTNGKDADESIKKDPVSFKKAIKNNRGVYDFLFDKTTSLYDKITIEGKKKIGEELLPYIARIKNEIVKEHYLKKLAVELNTSLESVLREEEKIEKKETVGKEAPLLKKVIRNRQEILEEYLFALIVQHDDSKEVWDIAKKILGDYQFRISSYQKISELLTSYFLSHAKFESKEFLRALPQELVAAFDTSFLFPLIKFGDKEDYQDEAEKVSKELSTLFLKNRMQTVIKSKSNDPKEKELSSIIGLLSKG